MRFTLTQFEDFLRSVNLTSYREKYQRIKTVEQDLPKNMRPSDLLYNIYWDKSGKKYKTPPSFDEFYRIYHKKYKDEINKFWDKQGYGKHCNCFKNGLKARIYRTWVSIITQIHAGYLAEDVFGADTVKQYAELDYENIDFQIDLPGKVIKVQVKKETKRREIARMDDKHENNPDINYIYYMVPEDYTDATYKRATKDNKVGEYREWAHMFVEYFPDEGFLDRFENGFVVFTRKVFEEMR